MCFFISFFPATFWLVIGYLVLFTSSRADDTVKKFGRWLAIWIFTLSGFIVLAGAFIALSGWCPLNALMQCGT